jgi:hypothetical protein
MTPQPVHKTKYPDDCPVVEELAIKREGRVKEAIKASADAVRKARDRVEAAKRIMEQARRLQSKR